MNAAGRPEGAARDTKADIHRAAVELFSSKGYDKTSLREIAERVGITKASLYYHYSSKQELLQAIVGTFFVLAAAEDNIDDLIANIREFHAWLAGPDPSTADLMRGVAATETIGSVLSSGLLPADMADDAMRAVVLDSALAVLDRRENVPFKHLEDRVVR
jgi:AcrR family transcriptional regulator